MTNRQKMIDKIRALMAKTIDNGCTEAEAMSALGMAQAMMDAYEVTPEDLELAGEKATVTQLDMRDPHHIRRSIGIAIAEFTGTQIWTSNNKKTMNFCGLQSDIEFAKWLCETLTFFVQKELKNYLWKNGFQSLAANNKRPIIQGFIIGCCNRITKRLRELNENATVSNNKNALIVLTNQLINVKMKELGLNLRIPRNRGTKIHANAFNAGENAGDRASFGRPVNGQAGTLRIGQG